MIIIKRSKFDVLKIKTNTVALIWKDVHGIAPDAAAIKVDDTILNWQSELTATLGIWIDKGLSMSEGELILPVIKATCHIKLVVPFLIVLLFAAGFTWLCTYFPFWNWIYVKDIVFGTLFAGIPVCFNAASRTIAEHYFKNIIIDNLKFAALVEFFTGTFTFHIGLELFLQPLLVLFMILQSTPVEKTKSVKKFIDGLVAIVGFGILALTIKSAVDSIGNIQFIDIVIGLILPIVLSVFYLPVAYFFAVYAKYEILFLRMGFKEPNDKKLKIKHRLAVIGACKLSHKYICNFLNMYIQKMYVNMSEKDFYEILNEFKKSNKNI